MADPINLHEDEQPFELSPFILAIMKIAREEGDYISEQTLRELEEKVTPEIVPHKHAALVASPKRIEITQEHLDTVKKVVDVVKVMVKVGSFLSEKVGKYIGPIGTVAGVVKDIVEYFEPKKDDPVLTELGELKKQLTAVSKCLLMSQSNISLQLSQKMTAHFDDLKSFVVEQDFYNRYTISISTLYEYMLDTLTERTNESVKLFEEVYGKNKPQQLVYDMLIKLELEAANPLKWAMKGDNLQSKETFNKWKNILESVLTEALFLEIYASGLLQGVGSHGVNRILEKIARYDELVKQWNEHYLTTEDFWPKGVETLVNEVHENRNLTSKDDKIEVLWKGIESIHTNFKFYAAVFPRDHIWHHYKHYESQAIVSDREGFVIVVYRSKVKEPYVRDRAFLRRCVERDDLRQRHTQSWQFNHWQIVRNYYNDYPIVENSAKFYGTFHLVVAQSKSIIASRYSETENSPCGPGYITYDAELEVFDGFTRSTFPLFLLHGL
ncbi:hypothetical protein CRE_04713 [Caenorhabditis remanei]|uniref:Uncharacterized protein n=1 Tax=Caenorhabditis remanei TaxID=31234 RepID=E3LYV5_CAERE|nr:hypothetical protein CRE_04713 [Caenorhabditis remanei]